MVALQNNIHTDLPVIYMQGSMDRKGIKTFNKNYALPESDMILNFKNITKIDSAGIGFLVKQFKYAYKRGFSIQLADIPLKIRILLEMTQIDQLFTIIENHNHQVSLAA